MIVDLTTAATSGAGSQSIDSRPYTHKGGLVNLVELEDPDQPLELTRPDLEHRQLALRAHRRLARFISNKSQFAEVVTLMHDTNNDPIFQTRGLTTFNNVKRVSIITLLHDRVAVVALLDHCISIIKVLRH